MLVFGIKAGNLLNIGTPIVTTIAARLVEQLALLWFHLLWSFLPDFHRVDSSGLFVEVDGLRVDCDVLPAEHRDDVF